MLNVYAFTYLTSEHVLCPLPHRFVKAGDKVEEFDRLCEVQSDKASVEITSRFTGTIASLQYKVGDMARVGSPLVEIETGDDGAVGEAVAAPDAASASTPAPEDGLEGRSHVIQDMNAVAAMMEAPTAVKAEIPTAEHLLTFATPAVRRVARENNVDIAMIKGSGKAGRVMKEDVMAYLANGRQATGRFSYFFWFPTGDPAKILNNTAFFFPTISDKIIFLLFSSI